MHSAVLQLNTALGEGSRQSNLAIRGNLKWVPLWPPVLTETTSTQIWSDYYQAKPTCAKRSREIAWRHRTLLDAIATQRSDRVIEIGVGTGHLCKTVLSDAHHCGNTREVLAVDVEPSFIADLHCEQTIGLRGMVANAFELPLTEKERDTTILFHQGLLEHFTDQEIILLVREQLRVARKVVASVPSEAFTFPEGLRGDERLMPAEQWREILSPFHLQISSYGQAEGEKYHHLLQIT